MHLCPTRWHNSDQTRLISESFINGLLAESTWIDGNSNFYQLQLSRLVIKPTKWSVHPAKTQISLGICPVWSESSLCAQWVAKDPSFFHADSEDSDQTGWMPRLIWVFAGRTRHFAGFVMRRLSLLWSRTSKQDINILLCIMIKRIYDWTNIS